MSTKPAAILTDADWRILKAALDTCRSKVGRPFADERRTVEAVAWRFKNDARWREIPGELGPWWRAAQLHYRWQKAGVWERLCAALREAGEPALADLFQSALVPPDAELDEDVLDQVSAGMMAAARLFAIPAGPRFRCSWS